MRLTARFILASAVLALTLVPSVSAEVVQRAGVRVSFDADLSPDALPRKGAAPVSLTVGGRIALVGVERPPPLERITIRINRHGRFDTRGLPRCRLGQIQPATNAQALHNCGDSLLGEGRFAARVLLADQAPFPSRGRVLAFYGVRRGAPTIFAHVYGTDPYPISFTFPFRLTRSAGGRFGTTLVANLDPALAEAGYLTYLHITLGGIRFGRLRAGCPAPKGTAVAPFPLASMRFQFAGLDLRSTMVRSCRVRGGARRG